MTTTQLISNLSTISKSRTSQFMKVIEERTDLSFIVQFYVFSTFLVASRVVFMSKHNDDD
jgi:HSP90 family molecular chaperone